MSSILIFIFGLLGLDFFADQKREEIRLLREINEKLDKDDDDDFDYEGYDSCASLPPSKKEKK